MKFHLLKGQMISSMVFEWLAVLHQVPRHAERLRFFPNVSHLRTGCPSFSLSYRTGSQWISQRISHRRKIVCCMVIILLAEYSSYGKSSCSLDSSSINRSVFCEFTERENGGLLCDVFWLFLRNSWRGRNMLKGIWIQTTAWQSGGSRQGC